MTFGYALGDHVTFLRFLNVIPYCLKFLRVKIFKDFEDFCLALKIVLLKILVLLQICLLKLIFSPWFRLMVLLLINILSVHYLWLAKCENFVTKISLQRKNHSTLKFSTLENIRLYGIIEPGIWLITYTYISDNHLFTFYIHNYVHKY